MSEPRSLILKNVLCIPKCYLSAESLFKHKKALTFDMTQLRPVDEAITSSTRFFTAPLLYLYYETSETLCVPAAYGIYENLLLHSKPPWVICDERYLGRAMDPVRLQTNQIRFTKPPMVNQEEIFQVCWAALQEGGFARPQMPCGTGKTVLALALAARAGRKTAVVVLKKFFVTQWTKEIQNKIPGLKVASVQSDGIEGNVDEADVVIFLLQSCVLGHQDVMIAEEEYGTVIYDECHLVGSQVFSAMVPLFACRYTIALTATPEKKDKLLEPLFGPITVIVHRPFQEVQVIATQVPSHDRVEKTRWQPSSGKREPNRMAMISDLSMDAIYNTAVTADIVAEMQSSSLPSPAYIIVLAETLAHLTELHARVMVCLGTGMSDLVGWAVGGTKDVSSLQQKRLLFATCAYASEGLDIPRLDRIFLVTPRADIRQAVGRILRIHPDKNVPRIYDYFHAGVSGIFYGMQKKHVHFYEQEEYTVTYRPWQPPLTIQANMTTNVGKNAQNKEACVSQTKKKRVFFGKK